MNAISTDAQTDAQRVAKMVAGMAEIMGVNAPPARILGYVEALRDIPLSTLAAAIHRTIQNWRFPDMPKVADIRDAADDIAKEEREKARRAAQEAAQRPVRDPMRPFGRMARYVVDRTFGSYVAHEACHCADCWEAKPDGPPRFVPDGTSPDRICDLCDDTGWVPGTAGAVIRCVCAGSNPNLRPDLHRVDMGRWIHGAELVEHERAQRAFYAALKRVGVNRKHVDGTEDR